VIKFFYISILCFLLGNLTCIGQVKMDHVIVVKDTVTTKINPLAPAKAAFYSAILPGLGQTYNKKYWKIPIVYGALGAGIYSYVWNKKRYENYRNAYKERLLVGEENTTDPYKGIVSSSTLITAQKFHERNKDLSLLVTVAIYILNIIDANVDAHLLQFNVNGKLTVRPDMYPNDVSSGQNLGLTLNYNF
jgi:Family of unknown function (DUF5683)